MHADLENLIDGGQPTTGSSAPQFPSASTGKAGDRRPASAAGEKSPSKLLVRRSSLIVHHASMVGSWLWRTFLRFRSLPVATDSAFLFANTMVGAILGVLFWTLAARQYDIAAVGVTSAVVSATTLIATLSNLGFGPIVIRFLPVAGERQRRLCLAATLIPAAVALVATTALMALPTGQATLGMQPGHGPAGAPLTIALAVTTAVMLSQDSVLVARRRSRLVFVRGMGAVLVRFALLVPCAWMGAPGLVVAFTCGVAAAVVLGAGGWRQPSTGGRLTVSMKQLAVYGGTNYVSGIFSQTPQLLYPILIALHVSHVAAGAFAFVWMASALLMALPPSVANVLLTRLADRPEQARDRIQGATRVMIGVSIGMAALMFAVVSLFAQVVLPEAASDIRAFLPLLLASTVVYTVVRLQSMAFALYGDMRKLLTLNGIVALAAVGLPMVLLPRFGVQGLEAGWMLSQLVGIAVGRALDRSPKEAPARTRWRIMSACSCVFVPRLRDDRR